MIQGRRGAGMEDRRDDYADLVEMLRRTKPSGLLSEEEWRYLEALGLRDQVRRVGDGWAALCRRSITLLMRTREGLEGPEEVAALDRAVQEIAGIVSSP